MVENWAKNLVVCPQIHLLCSPLFCGCTVASLQHTQDEGREYTLDFYSVHCVYLFFCCFCFCPAWHSGYELYSMHNNGNQCLFLTRLIIFFSRCCLLALGRFTKSLTFVRSLVFCHLAKSNIRCPFSSVLLSTNSLRKYLAP